MGRPRYTTTAEMNVHLEHRVSELEKSLLSANMKYEEEQRRRAELEENLDHAIGLNSTLMENVEKTEDENARLRRQVDELETFLRGMANNITKMLGSEGTR